MEATSKISQLTLFDKNTLLLWNGATDSLGHADFNVTFRDTNYNDTLRLEASRGNYSALSNVTFVSDTPIILEIRYFADLNGDGIVNILDITVVARAYGSKRGVQAGTKQQTWRRME